MDSNILFIIIGLAALIIGIVAGKFIFAKNTKKQVEEADAQSKKIISEAQISAENIKKEKILEAKEKFVQLKSEFDKEALERNRKLNESETRARQKEQSLNQKSENFDRQLKENEAIKDNLNRQIEVVNQKRTELKNTRKNIFAAWKKFLL